MKQREDRLPLVIRLREQLEREHLIARAEAHRRAAIAQGRVVIVVDSEDRFWVYATEGEAALLRRQSTDACRFYGAALATPHALDLGMVQSMYNQICRLYWALGPTVVQPVVNLLNERQLLAELDPGPFGYCERKRTECGHATAGGRRELP
jgi:hypothetical protein